jgi:4-alpha-glucanotransferase
MTDRPQALLDLAHRLGVATEYVDWTGTHHLVGADTLIAVLAAFGKPADTAEACETALAEHEREYWHRTLTPTIVTRSGRRSSFWVHVIHGAPVGVWIRLEDGTVRAGLHQLENNRPPFDLDGSLIGEATFELPADLPLGYHRLHVQAGTSTDAEATLIVTPDTLPMPSRLGTGRTWGLATQLYSVCSENSWGTGDLTDLTDLAVWSSTEHRAGFILVNPLHAAAPVAPVEPSPYLPTSRRFGNPQYLRVQAIAEYADVRSPATLRKSQAKAQSRAARSEFIDRDAAWKSKRAALKEVYEVKRSAGRELAYEGFRAQMGQALDEFATWCALAEKHGADWRCWPEEYQHPDHPAVRAFAEKHSGRVDFHRWLQWQLDDQLTAAQATAVQHGMALGIMHDLAVGVHPGGADTWALQDTLAAGVTGGAPPDEFNQLGQDWSQPPWRPDRLVERGYEPFRAVVNAVLRRAGGVRIDHIIGLFRLWWIPDGALPTEGTYVRYDHEAMVGIVALEAHRAGAVVVGEDLGTVEPWARDYLHERGLLGTSILWFESDHDGQPLPAQYWREYCLSSVTTHDLPPTAGYLAGEHLRLRRDLGLLTRPFDEEAARDRTEQHRWLERLQELGLLPVDATADADQIVRALYGYLGRTPSRLLTLALPDAVGDIRTQNQPGTSDEYPNWRVPLSGPDGRQMLLEAVFTDPRASVLAQVLSNAVTPDPGR